MVSVLSHALGYRVPTINWRFSLGFLAFVAYVRQVLTGVLITTHYASAYLVAFRSILSLCREAHQGFRLRSCHTAGVTLLLALLLRHAYKAALYTSMGCSGSRPHSGSGLSHRGTHMSGVLILVVTELIAFTGYSIAFGNRSY